MFGPGLREFRLVANTVVMPMAHGGRSYALCGRYGRPDRLSFHVVFPVVFVVSFVAVVMVVVLVLVLVLVLVVVIARSGAATRPVGDTSMSMCLGLAGIGALVFTKPCSSTHWSCCGLAFKPPQDDFLGNAVKCFGQVPMQPLVRKLRIRFKLPSSY